MDCLGHRITPGRLEVSLKREDTLEGFQIPATQTQVRSFLGMCNVYRRFLKDFGKIAGPLNDHLIKSMPADLWPLIGEQLVAFDTLEQLLFEPPIFRLPCTVALPPSS